LDTGLKTVSSPFALEKSGAPLRTAAPTLSQHTEEILQQLCGYSPEDILALKEKGVVW
jgi:crotonobetainyl-CoA:carnitine CoA-transferase CaiB-like acyl-CoA transferase